ncbi:kinase-like protein [Aspergillus heteromorphus CBS 117.55]|uniref:non-specific serine/threonine protein kinase n=1 Tax=Aspergillus heteromorphus CBS 117.55 TaxID=1448321 RepID=A0A317URZ3_9EURO|nr:kinase-like protein [Aspergillus heteromorphus CBS 117.55]PWY63878.1 kinase-like protein [Aspergillus heteromorphus CBS 117.55]
MANAAPYQYPNPAPDGIPRDYPDTVETWGTDFSNTIDAILKIEKDALKQACQYTSPEAKAAIHIHCGHISWWQSELATVIYDLMRPGSDLASEYTDLHDIFFRRWNASIRSTAEGAFVSRCQHLSNIHHNRYDSYENQLCSFNHPSCVTGYGEIRQAIATYANGICPTVHNRFELKGLIGWGTYGIVFLAYENQKPYAIKVQPYFTINSDVIWQSPRQPYPPSVAPLYTAMAGFTQENYVPLEAYVLILLRSSKRFPKFKLVYTHDMFTSMVMEACGLVNPNDYGEAEHKFLKRNRRKYPSYKGSDLIAKKRTSLGEKQANKLSTQLLEAMAFLLDMHICHVDLSHQNYAVDEKLNTKLLDMGLIQFGHEEPDFWKEQTVHIAHYEKFMTPELAVELFKDEWVDKDYNATRTLFVPLGHDDRNLNVWQLASLTYELLHGYSPWDDKQWSADIQDLYHYRNGRDAGQKRRRYKKIRARRRRIINESLPVHEDLTQDCSDALQMMLQKDVDQRPNLAELESVPWFGQWSYRDKRAFDRNQLF